MEKLFNDVKKLKNFSIEYELKNYHGTKSCQNCKRKLNRKLTLLTNWNPQKWGDYWNFIEENYFIQGIVIIRDYNIRKRNYICEYCELLTEKIVIDSGYSRYLLLKELEEKNYILLDLLPPRARGLIKLTNDWDSQLIDGFGDIFYSRILNIYAISHWGYLNKFNRIEGDYTYYIAKGDCNISQIIDEIYYGGNYE